ncbi:MAG: pectate lyase [Oscillospiraceae bacterium]|nr:pectate lyase [Oscillospiraceae bacterium]
MISMKKRLTAFACTAAIAVSACTPAVFGGVSLSAATVSAANAGGWYEAAYITWDPVSGASGYNVYADGKQIDSTLIRQYNGYYRADAVGLKAGSHTLKAVPVISGKEDSSKAVEKTVTVKAFDRSGFGWVNGTSSGAYNEDGTLKSGAVVLYVTEKTKDSVSCDIVTSSKGTTTTTTGIQEILNAIKKGYDSRPFCIRIVGTVTDPNGISSMGGDLTIDGGGKYSAGMTLEGIGEDALLLGFGVKVKNMSNLEIRNLGAMLCDSSEGDNFSLQQDNDHVWVHNCDSFYGMAGGDADQAKGDGALDCKKSTYITFSYNHFYDNGKCNLLGLKENTTSDLYITYHHNWYDHSDSRHPRVRFYTAHVYNNYYDGNAKYGIGSTQSSSIFAESNYFRNCKYPILTSMQGSDIATGGTFSSEDGGVVKAYGNIMEGQKSFIPYSQDNTSYDAYVVSNKSDKVPSSVIAKQTSKLGSSYSHTYNNFDTSGSMYSYTADAAKDVPAIVEANAGRMNGGDFKWEFNDAADDADYAVNTALMNALKAYRSPVVAIGSGSYVTPTDPVSTTATSSGSTSTTTSTVSTGGGSDIPVPASGYVHNFTENGTNSDFYSISGNLSTAKGTVNYAGLTLTQCLKIESATSVSFNAPAGGTLTLVFAEASATIKLDGTKYTADSTGIMSLPVSAGSHTLAKADTCNLFYMALSTEGAPAASATTSSSTTTSTTTATTTTSTESTQAPVTDKVFGDADCNGSVDVLDAVMIARVASEDTGTGITAEGKINADITQDGSVKNDDLSKLLKFLSNQIPSLS